ncbi:MAG: flagellar motor stator protein MotA [Alphaproteobacteria bacterium]|nr:flagellar motor stator protein MotA [Alphaproteobacteria bacterium]
MSAIVGIVVVLAMVFGGYIMAGGKMEIILHSLPYEMMIIGGAAVGAFIVANDFATIKHTGGDLAQMLAGPKWKKSDYRDLICLLYELVVVARQSPVAIEEHIENPESSSVFGKYPKIAKDHVSIDLICDTIRSIMMNFDNPHQVEELFDKQLDALAEESQHGAHALQNMADALPALGIVAAVLGVIKTMASIDKPPEVLGQMIGGALVGTFLGVFLAYGVVGPFATKVGAMRKSEQQFYRLIKETLVTSLQKHAPAICAEVARRNAPHHYRPSFSELEDALREIGTSS